MDRVTMTKSPAANKVSLPTCGWPLSDLSFFIVGYFGCATLRRWQDLIVLPKLRAFGRLDFCGARGASTIFLEYFGNI